MNLGLVGSQLTGPDPKLEAVVTFASDRILMTCTTQRPYLSTVQELH